MNEVRLPNGRLRRYRSKAEIAAIVAEFRASGSTPREFAEIKGINLNVLRRWLQRAEQANESGSKPQIPQFHEVQLPTAASSWVAEATLACGVSLKFGSEAPSHLVEKLWRLAGG